MLTQARSSYLPNSAILASIDSAPKSNDQIHASVLAADPSRATVKESSSPTAVLHARIETESDVHVDCSTVSTVESTAPVLSIRARNVINNE